MTSERDRPVLFFLHGLGCSAGTWSPVINALGSSAVGAEFDCVALDLPGHGSAADSGLLTVEQMVGWIIAELLARRPGQWALIGHSMGGKLATIVTAAAETGLPGLTRPFGLVLVAASPLTAEPMDEATRADMIGWAAAGSVSEPHARAFVDANTASQLPPNHLDAAVADVQRVSRTAWLAWLERGSREDWSGSTELVRTPTLVVAGAEDGALGPDAQRHLVLPRVAATEVVEVADAAHLIALEQTERLAQLVAEHVRSTSTDRAALPPDFVQLIESDRVSARTRQVLLARMVEPAEVAVLNREQRYVLAALLARVVPQRGTNIDLVTRIDAQLAARNSDGWRFAELPADIEAWRHGLDTLDIESDGFTQLDAAAQDAWIERMIAGEVGSDEPGRLTADQMTLWFEDVRAEAVRTWLAHPAALARIGYDGFANGGDGARKQGYLRTGTGEREPWQRDLPLIVTKQEQA